MNQQPQDILTFNELGDGQFYVFEQLYPLSTINAAACVSHAWNDWIHSLWKDLIDYLNTKPASEKELGLVKSHGQVTSYPENSFAHFVPYAPILAPDLWKKNILNPPPVRFTNKWHQLYFDCSGAINLSGTWKSIYGGHGEEFVKVEHTGYKVVATKLKGDINVPATKRTFEVTILENSNGRIGIGRIHLAEPGYRNPHWGFATINIINHRKFELYWYLAEEYLVSNTYTWSEDQNIPMGRPETEIFALMGLP